MTPDKTRKIVIVPDDPDAEEFAYPVSQAFASAG